MYYKDKNLNSYLNEKLQEYKAQIIKTDKVGKYCSAVTLFYNNKYIIYINETITEKRFILTALHELSHIKLNYLGYKYEKKGKKNLKEKIVNFNMVWSNRRIFEPTRVFYYLFLALLSEDALYKNIDFIIT